MADYASHLFLLFKIFDDSITLSFPFYSPVVLLCLSSSPKMALKNPYEDSPRRSTIDEERKGMLDHFDSIDLPRVEDTTHTHSKSRRYLLPLSLASNLLLFVVILFQLAHPCFFSARTCVYDKRGQSQEQVMEVKGMELMGDVNKIVPECMKQRTTTRSEFQLIKSCTVPTQKVVFMNDSRYSNENMFKNEKEFNHILTTWEKDMPRKHPSHQYFSPY
jgi:hypothetical protein